VETEPPTSVEAWFLYNSNGELRVGDPDSPDTQPTYPAFWMHISQEWFMVTELSNNLLLNRFDMACPGPQRLRRNRLCSRRLWSTDKLFQSKSWGMVNSGWKICGDLDDQFNLTCSRKEELTGGTEACGRYIIRVGAEPHVLERCVCVNVGGIKFPVFMELASHRVAARPPAQF
jgi:hypothetical protein